MGKTFVVETSVVYRQEYDSDWVFEGADKPENPTKEDILKYLEDWAPDSEEYFYTNETAQFEDPVSIRVRIVDPESGESVDMKSTKD